jgi:uncharacterized coiled-coil protein SlyX
MAEESERKVREIQVPAEVFAMFQRREQRIDELTHQIDLQEAKIAALQEIVSIYRDALAALQTRDQLAALINKAEMHPLVKAPK